MVLRGASALFLFFQLRQNSDQQEYAFFPAGLVSRNALVKKLNSRFP